MASRHTLYLQELQSGQPCYFEGYCLLCKHCGRVSPYLYGALPRLKQCRSCGRAMTCAACIVTPTLCVYNWSDPLTSADESKTTKPE